MEKTIKEKLLDLADDKYQKFAAALLPNIDNVLGVRLPLLRKLAREIAKGDWRGIWQLQIMNTLRKLCFKVWCLDM